MSSAAALPAISKLSPRVVRVMGFNPGAMTLQGSNVYLVGTGAQRLLVDSGEGKPQFIDALKDALAAETAELGRPVGVSHLFLTHWHGDHVGGVEAVRRLYPEVVLYKKPSAYEPIPEDALCLPPPAALSVEGASLDIVPTPGHTDDHVCLFLKEERAMFTSDTILGTGTSVFACYTDYMSSLNVLKSFQPEKLYPAHGPVVADGVAKIEEIIAHRERREQQIMETLSASNSEAGLSIMALVQRIYAATTPQHLWPAAGLNVFHQLKKLIREGRVAAVKIPAEAPDVLSEASDYSMLGEGVKADPAVMNAVFNELLVAKTKSS